MRSENYFMNISIFVNTGMKYLLLVLFLFFASAVFAQKDVKQLFENREFDEIITILGEKYENNELPLEEYYWLARSYGRTRQYSNGLLLAKEMENLCVKEKDTVNLLKAFNIMAENLMDLGKIKEGIEYCELASTVFRKQDSIAFQDLCFKWGLFYRYNNEPQKAFETYNKITLKKYRKLSLFTNNYGIILKDLGKYEEAIENYRKALKYSYENNNDGVVELTNIAEVFSDLKDMKKTKLYLDSAADALTDNTQLYLKESLYQKYFTYYKSQGELDSASRYLDFISITNEEKFDKKINEKIHAMETANRREQTLNDALEASRKEKLWGTIVLLFVIMGLVSILYLFKYRNIKSAHENVLIEQKLLRSQMTPHFIFNSLSVLQGMILNNEDKKAIKYLSKFSKLLRLILENSREKLVPINEELSAIQNYVDLHNMRSKSNFKYTLTLDENIEESELLIPPMLIQPFVENAIEHGFKKDFTNAEIFIDIKFDKNKLVCMIKDNGIGIDASKTNANNSKKSLSTTITSERLKILSKEYKVESGVVIQDRSIFDEQGTQITLTLPYKTDRDA